MLIEVAKVKSHKKRRLKFLWQNHRNLIEDLYRVGLLNRDYLLEDQAFADQFGEHGMTEDGEPFPDEEWEYPEYWDAKMLPDGEIPF